MAVPLGGAFAALFVPALEHLGGIHLVLAIDAVVLALAGASIAALSGGLRSAAPAPRPFLRILRVPGIPKLFLIMFLFVIDIQAMLTYTVPAVRSAGCSAFVAGVTYFAVNVAAIVSLG